MSNTSNLVPASDFPILSQRVHDKHLVYLDSAATSQKPQVVLDRIARFYQTENANVHRGIHELSSRATRSYDSARQTVQTFINAREVQEIIFTRGATEGLNLIAQSFARPQIKRGDTILLTEMEHHSNIVPWQLLAKELGAELRVVPTTATGDLDVTAAKKMLAEKPRLFAVTHVSNVLGTINPIKELTKLAHANGVPVIVDGAQAVGHIPVDVQDLDADFYVFSGHKVYAPTGIGVLYGKREHLEKMAPYQSGGDMILSVSFDETTFAALPTKFEAGTQNIEGALALATALDYVSNIGLSKIVAHEQDLTSYARATLSKIPNLKLLPAPTQSVGLISFVVEGVHAHDVGTILDQHGLAVRTGNLCAEPLVTKLALGPLVRASFGVYTTRADIDRLVEALGSLKKLT